MERERRQQLMSEYKLRKPEMGILSFRCTPTQESFIMGSKDTKADYNSNCFQLDMGGHYNRPLQKLWSTYGKDAFEIKVLEVLPYEEKTDKVDYSEDLEVLCCCYLEKDEKMKRIKNPPH